MGPRIEFLAVSTAAIAEFGGIVYGDEVVKSVPLEIVILCGGLVVMLATVLTGGWWLGR